MQKHEAKRGTTCRKTHTKNGSANDTSVSGSHNAMWCLHQRTNYVCQVLSAPMVVSCDSHGNQVDGVFVIQGSSEVTTSEARIGRFDENVLQFDTFAPAT